MDKGKAKAKVGEDDSGCGKSEGGPAVVGQTGCIAQGGCR